MLDRRWEVVGSASAGRRATGDWRFVWFGACVVAALALACGRVSSQPADVAQFDCEIMVERVGGRVDVWGRISASRATEGTYQLSVRALGSSASHASQSAPFRTAPGAPALVGVVSLTAGAKLEATLRIVAGSASSVCHRTVEPAP